MKKNRTIIIVGGGLAGCEAAYQISKFGINAELYEMRPETKSPAHKTSNLGELVCSNSLKSDSLDNASGILKREMEYLDSIVIKTAYESKVPAGKALAVDREIFSQMLTNKIEKNSLIKIFREEVKKLPSAAENLLILASGPLTSDSLSKDISSLTGSKHLYFYDSISPIIGSESIDYSKTFKASRYEVDSEGDYINCPLNRQQYYELVKDLIEGEKIETHHFEKQIYFEACMPVEAICERGEDTLRFGPMKPVGLIDPKEGKRPFAVLQLRTENKEETMYNMVGFQTKLRYPEQRRVFRKIPGLENAEFLRYGSIHRNTYINSPELLNSDLSLKSNNNIYFAGQITGVEGYVESAAMGIIAGINTSRKLLGLKTIKISNETAIGSLIEYITTANKKSFQPININFGLFPEINKKMNKSDKRELIANRSFESLSNYKPYTQ
ncbi:MAG: methylenetetrahydrofolate--tRNA-(uracil(54)-C(5))-methyltransferase (FADH(2)-oxidizing) TrmFO [Thermodesulfobacteriota bacterium]